MKIMSKNNLLAVIALINDREEFDLDDMERIFDRFGEDHYVVDGIFQKCKDNDEMKEICKQYKTPLGDDNNVKHPSARNDQPESN